jgi:hypothetical protein
MLKSGKFLFNLGVLIAAQTQHWHSQIWECRMFSGLILLISRKWHYPMWKYSKALCNFVILIVNKTDVASETLVCLAFANMSIKNVFSVTDFILHQRNDVIQCENTFQFVWFWSFNCYSKKDLFLETQDCLRFSNMEIQNIFSYCWFYLHQTYIGDNISLKISNVKLNIIDICNLIMVSI